MMDDVNDEDLALMTMVARDFYLEDLSRVDIAARRGISRFKVARLLDEARASGVVTISIRPHGLVDQELSTRIAEQFGLRDALAVFVDGDRQAMYDQLGEAAARYLTRVVGPEDVLGFDTGRTVGRIADRLTELPPCDVVQLAGLAGTVQLNGLEILRRVADATHGEAYPLYAPMLAVDPQAASLYRRQDEVRRTMEQYRRLSVAVVSVGSWVPPESQVYDGLGHAERDRLRASGVVGESCAIMVDAQGRVLDGLEDRRIGIPVEALRAVPNVIAVAGGAVKAGAIGALLRSGLVDSLVTDTATARKVLDGPEGDG